MYPDEQYIKKQALRAVGATQASSSPDARNYVENDLPVDNVASALMRLAQRADSVCGVANGIYCNLGLDRLQPQSSQIGSSDGPRPTLLQALQMIEAELALAEQKLGATAHHLNG